MVKNKKSNPDKNKKTEMKNPVVFKPQKIKVRLIGIGGGAASIIADMASLRKKGISFALIDTDKRSFKRLKTGVKPLQIGETATRGWGTGMNAALAEKIGRESMEKISRLTNDVDLAIIIGCLGGGVGSGVSPVVAEILKSQKKISIGIFTLPFAFEGDKKMRLARNSLKDLQTNLSGTIVFSNEDILSFSDKKSSLKNSLSLINRMLTDYLSDLSSIISSPGIINIDFADLKNVLKERGQTLYFGSGLGQGPTKINDALEHVFSSPFFGKPKKIKRIIFNVSAGDDLSLKELEEIALSIYNLNPKGKIIFGLDCNPKMRKKVKVVFLGASEDSYPDEKNGFSADEEKEKVVKNNKISGNSKVSNKDKKHSEGKKSKAIKSKSSDKKELAVEIKAKSRRSALEIKKEEDEQEQEEWSREPEWEIPAFLRKKI